MNRDILICGIKYTDCAQQDQQHVLTKSVLIDSEFKLNSKNAISKYLDLCSIDSHTGLE